jgi:hypothetical protein
MDEAAVVCEGAVAADEDVVCDGLSEYLYFEDVCDDLLCLAVEIGVDECDVVIAGDDVSEGGQALFDALDGDGGREGVAEMLEFLVGGGRGNE